MYNKEACKTYYSRNREKCLASHKAYRKKISNTEKYKKTCVERMKKYRLRPGIKEKIKFYSSKKNFYDKIKCIKEYGGKCFCCGESIHNFLTLDHINNDGHIYRKTNTKHSWRYAIKNNFPKDILRLSCYNCNCGRVTTFNKVCPHKNG